MRKLGPVAAATAAMFVLAAAPAGAGQPNASCETDPGSNPPPGFAMPGFEFATTVRPRVASIRSCTSRCADQQ